MRLINSNTKIRVSSTLDKSSNKKYLTDRNAETCWSSTQGIPQHVELTFENPIVPHSLSITFQGGFVGTGCAIYIKCLNSSTQEGEHLDSSQWDLLDRFFPQDVNRKQTFLIQDRSERKKSCEQLRIVFEQSSDFFGRIVVYDLDLDGDTLTT